MKRSNPALLGVLSVMAGFSAYLIGVAMALPRRLLWDTPFSLTLNESIVWYSGVLVILGFFLILVDLIVFLPSKRKNKYVMCEPPAQTQVTVVLTAYNDDASIGAAIEDFKQHPFVERVVVVSNNSRDLTFQKAQEAGAIVYNEELQGYGACVYRALSEGLKFTDTELTLLCEGDMTFRANDLSKFMAYIQHADIVNGTRIVEQLRDRDTQLTTFMYYGNFFVGKLLEIKHLGRGTFTDAGTTYKLCRNKALMRLLPGLDPRVNLEFNAYFLDKALELGLTLVECPVTFHKRLGNSKGGNINNTAALKVGLAMILGILLNWRRANP